MVSDNFVSRWRGCIVVAVIINLVERLLAVIALIRELICFRCYELKAIIPSGNIWKKVGFNDDDAALWHNILLGVINGPDGIFNCYRNLVRDIREHKGLPNDEASLMEDALNSAK